MFVVRTVLRTRRQLCHISSCAPMRSPAEPLAAPPPDGMPASFAPKVEKLVDDISKLTLLEVSELSTALKQRLNLPDVMAAPVGAMSAAPLEAQDEEDTPKSVKTDFTVKLMKYDEKQKVALIKEMKSLLEGMNLVQAKKFVESAPAVVKADVSKDEAEKLKEALVKVGAEIVID